MFGLLKRTRLLAIATGSHVRWPVGSLEQGLQTVCEGYGNAPVRTVSDLVYQWLDPENGGAGGARFRWHAPVDPVDTMLRQMADRGLLHAESVKTRLFRLVTETNTYYLPELTQSALNEYDQATVPAGYEARPELYSALEIEVGRALKKRAEAFASSDA